MKFDIVIYLIGIGSWRTFHRRPMIEALARNAENTARILCIDQPVSPLMDVIVYRERFLEWLRAPGLCQMASNLFVYSPVAWLHRRLAERIRGQNLYEQMVSFQIRRTLAELGFSQQNRVCWLYRPEQIACVGWGQETFTVYECYDEYRDQFDGDAREQVVHDERLMLEHADMVFTTSQSLYQSRSQLHSNVHYAPNGVDYELFSMAHCSMTPVADDLAAIPEPRIGYVGNISNQLDLALMLQIALTHPEWSIVLIGPLDGSLNPTAGVTERGSFDTLRCLKNVHVLGTKPYHSLPSYLRGISVAIIPYSLNAWAHDRNPLKLWEYLAAGKAVVSTALRQVNQLEDVVYIARTPEEFISTLNTALTADNSERIKKGVTLARTHNWDRLTKRMLDVLSADVC